MASRFPNLTAEHLAPLLAIPIAAVLVVASAAVRGDGGDAPDPRKTTVAAAVPLDTIWEDRDAPAIEPPATAPRRAGAARSSDDGRPQDNTIRWRRVRSLHCFRHDGRRYCDGPLRAPEPHGPAAARATELGLDDARRVASHALGRAPDTAWRAALESESGRGLRWPVDSGRLARGYGETHVLVPVGDGRAVRPGDETRLHPGVDIAAKAGSAIRAVDPALVLYADDLVQGYGNALILLHPDASVTLYAHCRALLVFAGQRVERGDVIAEVGQTGLAHGPHLHFEWRRDGNTLNPGPHFVDVPARGETAAANSVADP